MKSFVIEQKITPLANQYRVFTATEAGQKEALLCFAQQKRFTFKEEFHFYTDESKQAIAFTVKAEKVVDIHGKFLVTDPNGKLLGAVRKAFGASLLRSTWEILNGEEVAAVVQEKSQAIAIFRRVWQLLPLISDVPFFIKYHFIFVDPAGKQLGIYSKTSLIRDHYQLNIADDNFEKAIGWQTLAAQAVLLDALQGR